jgi:hypothetical protein
MNIYANNTVASYKIQLPERIELEGSWLVALAECTFPVTWYTVPEQQYFRVCSYSGPTKDGTYVDIGEGNMEVPAGYYQSPKDLIESMQQVWKNYWNQYKLHDSNIVTAVDQASVKHVDVGTYVNPQFRHLVIRPDDETAPDVMPDSLKMSLDVHNNTAKFVLYNEAYELKFSNYLAEILGINKYTVPVTNVGKKVYISDVPVDLHRGNHSMFVYCSVVSDSIVGDKRVPLLRSFPISDKKHGIASERFTRLQYIPVKSNHFDSIEVELRNEIGQLIPFNFGHSSCVLHFKRDIPALIQ